MKKYILPLILILLGVGLRATYSIIGSEVDQNGFLIEPFWLIPIGHLLILAGIIITIRTYFKSYLPNKKIKAVIFDRDGVILDSESINIGSAVKAFQELGIEIEEKEKDWIIGRHTDDYIKLFLEKYDFTYEEFRKIQKEALYELLDTIPLFDKTILLIRKLHKQKIPLAITTSAGLESTLRILKNADLENIFDVIVTHENYEKRKPNPESYEITAKKLKLSPKDCVVIEDSSIGIEAAKTAGMKCIAIPNEYTKNQDFSKADLIINSAEKIDIKLLNSI
jgi:HAD superfamily hydrolase (TIGR01509 family)